MLVSAELPLRANLSVLENIVLIPQYRQNQRFDPAADLAWTMLHHAGYGDIAFKRDPDLTHEERFAAKLLRAAAADPALLVIDRPGMLLPDTFAPPFVAALLERTADHLNACWIVEYVWNKPLYPRPDPSR